MTAQWSMDALPGPFAWQHLMSGRVLPAGNDPLKSLRTTSGSHLHRNMHRNMHHMPDGLLPSLVMTCCSSV